jgi:hypothetical protein
MDSSDCVLLIVNQAQRNQYLATSSLARLELYGCLRDFGSKLISGGHGSYEVTVTNECASFANVDFTIYRNNADQSGAFKIQLQQNT